MADWIMGVLTATGAWGLGLLTFIENLFPPLPSELILPLAGYLVGLGKLPAGAAFVAGTLGSLIGALPLYHAGRALGPDRLGRLLATHGRWLGTSPEDFVRSTRWFERHGAAAVLVARLIPGARSLIAVPAGLAGMNLAVFVLCTTLGSALWTGLLLGAGYLLGSRFRQVGEYLDPIAWIGFAALVGAYLWRVIRARRPPPTRAARESPPPRSAWRRTGG